MKRTTATATLLMSGATLCAASTDKTLVSWVTLANRDVRAGSVLTIQDGDQFDGIVFAERLAGKWMAGSDYYRRTEKGQGKNQRETADNKTLLQMAIVYEGSQVSIFRNGELYSRYAAKNIDLLSREDNIVVSGLRHIGGTGSIAGAIDDARIYSKALSVDELKSLKPNQPSSIEPYAWWSFENDLAIDHTGRFAHSAIGGKARIAGGKLVLERNAVLAAARSQQQAKEAVAGAVKPKGKPAMIHTPTMPTPIPDTWLTYHLAHPGPDRAIPGDPNCAIFHKGRYHLFYIYSRQGPAFAHVSSTDMVHWKWHPTTLWKPKTGHGMFSGTAFRTADGRVAIIYHGQGSGRNQLAFALDDDLNTWSDPVPVEPVTEAGDAAQMRHWDPDCWMVDGVYYAIGGGKNPTLATSTDLKSWLFRGDLLHPDFPKNLGVPKTEDISCANMFRLGDKWMLLCISHALGCRYYLGDFKDGQYLPSHHAMMNWARWDCFAPESLLTPDGRRVMWSWCTQFVHRMQKLDRPSDFKPIFDGRIQPGIQSLPRELSLADDGSLRIKPLRELRSLRHNERRKTDLRVKRDSSTMLPDVSGDTLELEITFKAPTAEEFGVELLCDKEGKNGFPIIAGRDAKTLKVGYITPPFELREGEDLTLRIFIDKSMIEVFANDRQAAVAWHEYDPEDLSVSLFSKGGDVTVKTLAAWDMKSIYRGSTVYEPSQLKLKENERLRSGLKLEQEKVKRVKELMQHRKSLADCPYRPLYHLSTPKGRMHDPGGIAFWNGNYHLFYIGYGGKGHAVSDDLVHWQDLPGIPNIGGLTGQMLVRDGEALMSVTRDGSVNLASSRDALLLRWDCKPVLSLGEDLKGYQSPVDSCFWKEEDGTWSMLLRKHRWTMGAHFGGGLPTGALFRSDNLSDWEYHGIFFEKANAVEPGDDLACPNFLPIGQDRHILIWFCHPRGPMYAIGRYDEENGKFNAEHHGRFSNGAPLRGSLHAPSAFIAPDGRLITVFNVTERNKNRGGWIGMMSLPRQLSLREGYGKRTEDSEENKRDYFNPLRIEPAAELGSLRQDPVSVANIVSTPNQEVVLPEVEGTAMEIVAEIDPMKASELELRVLRSPGGEEYTTIRLYMEGAHGRSEYARTLSVDVSTSSLAPSARSRTPESGFVWMKEGDPLRLRVFIDRSIVEVFANENQCLTMRTYPSREDSTGVSFYSRGHKAEIKSLTAYQMHSIWPELGGRG